MTSVFLWQEREKMERWMDKGWGVCARVCVFGEAREAATERQGWDGER